MSEVQFSASVGIVAEPAVPTGEEPVQYLTYDGSGGCTGEVWNSDLQLFWDNVADGWKTTGGGTWMDANGTKQGATPYVSTAISALGTYTWNVTALVARQVAGTNRGFLLKQTGTDFSAGFGGRPTVNAPRLTVVTTAGTFECPCLAAKHWSPGYTTKTTSTTQFLVQRGLNFAIVQFDYSAVAGTVISATMALVCTKYSARGTVQVFEADPPEFHYGNTSTAANGLAANYPMDVGIASHPSVLFATDFPSYAGFDQVRKSDRGTFHVDPDTGLRYLRTTTIAGDQSGVGLTKNFVTATERGGNVLSPPVDDLYFRYYLFLENDWLSTVDTNKLPGIDCRMGVWNGTRWEPHTGNGGSYSDGRLKPNHDLSGVTGWCYHGQMTRGHSGQYHPGSHYSHLVYLRGYIAHIDEGRFGPGGEEDVMRWGNSVTERGKWVCLESHLKMNTLTGTADAYGNREAAFDGWYEQWVGGKLVRSQKDMRWRRHPDLSCAAIDMSMYHGGTSVSRITMNARWAHVVCATEPIGPMRGGWNAENP